MAKIIHNKLTIIPQTCNDTKLFEEANEVLDFCGGVEDGFKKAMCFSLIKPKPGNLKFGTKEEDDWLLHNWGTRYKAFHTKVSEKKDEISFDTYWHPAIPILIELSNKFPHVFFFFEFASNNKIGTCTGEMAVFEGRIEYMLHYDDYSSDAYEKAFDMFPEIKTDYVKNIKTGTYTHDISEILVTIEENGFYRDKDGTILIGTDDKNKDLFDTTDDLPY